MSGVSKNSKKAGDKLPDEDERKKATWPKGGPKGNTFGTGDATGKGRDTKIMASRPKKPTSRIPVPIPSPSQAASTHSLPIPPPPSTISELKRRSHHSQMTKDSRGNAKHVFQEPDPDKYEELIDLADVASERSSLLLLDAGHGGTFGFGRRYKTENGGVSGDELRDNPSKIKHLTYFGRNVDLIGTMCCITCTGVYFELKGHRVFCVHINTWHDGNSFNVSDLEKDSPQYEEIWNSVYNRLEVHAQEHSWTWEDVKRDTILIICPEPQAQAYVVLDVLIKFLELPYIPPIYRAHGFVLRPGLPSINGEPAGKLLMTEWKEENGTYTRMFEDLPKEVKKVDYRQPSGEEILQMWCYTVGHKWHHIYPREDRFSSLRTSWVDQDSTVQEFEPYGTKKKKEKKKNP